MNTVYMHDKLKALNDLRFEYRKRLNEIKRMNIIRSTDSEENSTYWFSRRFHDFLANA